MNAYLYSVLGATSWKHETKEITLRVQHSGLGMAVQQCSHKDTPKLSFPRGEVLLPSPAADNATKADLAASPYSQTLAREKVRTTTTPDLVTFASLPPTQSITASTDPLSPSFKITCAAK